MIDDYQYTPSPLPPKNEGYFGFGGQPSEGSAGLMASTNAVGGGGGGGGQGPMGPMGPRGPAGPGILAPPATGTYILGSIDGTVQWIATTDCGATG